MNPKGWSVVRVERAPGAPDTVLLGDRESWGVHVTFRVEPPTSGRRYTFDLIVTVHGVPVRYIDLEDEGTWWKRLWHRARRLLARWGRS